MAEPWLVAHGFCGPNGEAKFECPECDADILAADDYGHCPNRCGSFIFYFEEPRWTWHPRRRHDPE